MTSASRYQVPKEHGGIFVTPPLDEAIGLISRNQNYLTSQNGSLFSHSWQSLQALARREAIALAVEYLEEHDEPVPSVSSDRLIMTGHQPELYHPGVWIKNFAAQGLARHSNHTALNLLVDNDVIRTNAIRLPPVNGSLPPVNQVPTCCRFLYYADHLLGTPYEEAQIKSEQQFAQPLANCPRGYPLLQKFWKIATEKKTTNVGERFAAARRQIEREWGCHNLELPLSRLAGTESFAWFVCHLLTHLPRFQMAYNLSLQAYRRREGIRSHAHPVPDLQAQDEWLEAPFWAWQQGERRCRLLAKQSTDSIILRFGKTEVKLPGGPDDQVEAILALKGNGIKLRSRALTTTLFCRLFLADLFIHGIGGARYDEVTDAIIREFYQVEPPGFLTLSGTLRLPLSSYPVEEQDCQRLQHLIRDLQYNPQRHLLGLGAQPVLADLVAQKEGWMHRPAKTVEGRQKKHRALRFLTQQLQPFVEEQVALARQRLKDCRRQHRVNEMLRRRDYAICLFPESTIRDFCQQFLDSPLPEAPLSAPAPTAAAHSH